MYLYVAEELTPGPQHLEADEHLEPKIISWRDALARVDDGTIRDAKTLVALLTWQRLRS